MKQVNSVISTYSADVFGAASALFELGGMTVIHDPSGCNSTYTTHDEPRWFNSKTLLYISGLTEQDAILGNDKKLIDEVSETAIIQKPRFIALLSAQMPAMLGIDLKGISRIIEKNTDIPTFSLPTNSMRDYSVGISLALGKIVDIITNKTVPIPEIYRSGVNLLGLTPLDFALNGTNKSIIDFFEGNGISVISKFAMGCDFDGLFNARKAKINIVLTYGGLFAARTMKKLWGIPYIIGLPVGKLQSKILNIIKKYDCFMPESGATATNGCILWQDGEKSPFLRLNGAKEVRSGKIYLIHESVIAASLATAIEEAIDEKITVIYTTSTEKELMREGDEVFKSETELAEKFKHADLIIADPMYKPIAENKRFVCLPHIAFSGRTYQRSYINFISEFIELTEKVRKALRKR
ncbi:MAG: hypothetical protein J6O04_10200 [Selenomonadaceae bacterium]|nr:hypothetical protein [Selenomonadaceae bacterium]